MAFSGAVLTRSTNQTVSNNTFPVITWDTVEYDTDSYSNLGTHNERFTIPTTGYYMAGVQLRWSAAQNASAGVRGGGIWMNGDDPTSVQDIGYNEWPSSGLSGALMHQTPVMHPRHFTAGDYIRAHAYMFTGSASLDIESLAGRTPAFWIIRLG